MSIVKTGIEVDTTDQFSNPTSFEENGVVSSINASGLTAETGYYVRAYVVDDQGNRIDGENIETFTTEAQPVQMDYFYIQCTGIGGTYTLHKNRNNMLNGNTLEYSYDKQTWSLCTYDSNNDCKFNLQTYGDKVYLRSTDGFSSGVIQYYTILGDALYALGGDITTLVDYTDPNITHLPDYFWYSVCDGGTTNFALESTSDLNLEKITSVGNNCFTSAFQNCYNLDSIKAPNIQTWDQGQFYYWVNGVAASGRMYCPTGVTIPTGKSGIPSGWTRVDY